MRNGETAPEVIHQLQVQRPISNNLDVAAEKGPEDNEKCDC